VSFSSFTLFRAESKSIGSGMRLKINSFSKNGGEKKFFFIQSSSRLREATRKKVKG